jgi:hypothetical protein
MNFTKGQDNGYSKKNMQPLILDLQKNPIKAWQKICCQKKKITIGFALAPQKYTIGLK